MPVAMGPFQRNLESYRIGNVLSLSENVRMLCQIDGELCEKSRKK